MRLFRPKHPFYADHMVAVAFQAQSAHRWTGVQRKIRGSRGCALDTVPVRLKLKAFGKCRPILVVAHARAMPPTLHFHIIAYVSGYTIWLVSNRRPHPTDTQTPHHHSNGCSSFFTQIFGKIRAEISGQSLSAGGDYCVPKAKKGGENIYDSEIRCSIGETTTRMSVRMVHRYRIIVHITLEQIFWLLAFGVVFVCLCEIAHLLDG